MNLYLIRILLILFFLGFYSGLFAQTKITGRIINSDSTPVANANIVIVKRNQAPVFAFSISDSTGKFLITYDSDSDSMVVKISCIGFENITRQIENKSQLLNFILAVKSTELPEVEVLSPPVIVRGDTIDYNVKSFATPNDRVIGDVIAKLPGIEVDPSGAIKYNGKFISKFYINGLDLLEGRYNIANRNIPFDMVDKVQVLDNHQQIKLLDSLKRTTATAINIELKKNARNKLISLGKLGIGLTPLLTDDELTAMQFNKGVQFISTYKFNNTGYTLVNDLADLVKITALGEEKTNSNQQVLSLVSLPSVNIKENRYVFNSNNLFNIAAIKTFKNTGSLKANIGYFNDHNIISGKSITTLFLPSDTIAFIENQVRSVNTDRLMGDFVYDVNNKKKYIKNTTKFEMTFDKSNGRIWDTGTIVQQLKATDGRFSNDFLMLLPVGKKIISVKSNTGFNPSSQELYVQPGQFNKVLNQSVSYAALTQKVSMHNFVSNNSLGLSAGKGKWQHQFLIGVEYISKHANTGMEKLANQAVYQLSDSFQNKLNWQNLRNYVSIESVLKTNKVQFEVRLPVELNNLNISDNVKNARRFHNYFFMNPDINLILPFKSFYTIEAGISRKNVLGDILQTTQGFILTSYRTISKNDSLIPQKKINSLLFTTSYKNPLLSFFCNFSLSLSRVQNNILYDQLYYDFFVKRTSIQYSNVQYDVLISNRISKYILPIKTSFSSFINYNTSTYSQIRQGELTRGHSSSFNLSLKINCEVSNLVSLEQNAQYGIFQNKVNSLIQPFYYNASQFQQFLNVYFFLSKVLTVNLNTEYYSVFDKQSNNRHSYFFDLGIRYKSKKYDFELGCMNITNSHTYNSVIVTDNFMQRAQMTVRPLSILLTCNFRFNR